MYGASSDSASATTQRDTVNKLSDLSLYIYIYMVHFSYVTLVLTPYLLLSHKCIYRVRHFF